MKKKVSIILAGLVLMLAFQAGSAFASASKMDGFIDELIGTRYSYGGTTTKGFDCSGFTSYVFNKMGIDLPRRSADQAGAGTKVAKADLQPGDLVFFDTSGKNNGGISHVGIYVGDGNFAHASTSKGVIIEKLDSSYYKPRYVTAARILDESQIEKFIVAAEK
ncbi:NlpC/P60 family protein [Paenibacillus sp. 1011MAR3C5]|uniref:C40 family peptidase n=1 Tax=Paenibacillus sp. 1011MAR3C5 TaxID=1675787 RepID=UPI000E6BFE6D|nr:C40 family peptidase [Paenibacillus sp. 1011MAR3C5]RJE85542.1 NlpC/P60 family protein [Paenibacillus sp. 1011MAR3C5]